MMVSDLFPQVQIIIARELLLDRFRLDISTIIIVSMTTFMTFFYFFVRQIFLNLRHIFAIMVVTGIFVIIVNKVFVFSGVY